MNPNTVDARPTAWLGHAGPVEVPDLGSAVAFYEAVGLHRIHGNDSMVALQLRGGTHLVLLAAAGGVEPVELPFDFMVDDLAAMRDRLIDAGADPGPIERRGAHERFDVRDPAGHRVRIHDSHVVGPA